MGPIVRTAARVLPVSPDGEVLLVQCQDPVRPADLRGISVGGAVRRRARTDGGVR